MARSRFDLRSHAGRPMVAAATFTYEGVDYEPGDPFPKDGELDPRRVASMHGARRINFAEDPDQQRRDGIAARRADLLATPKVKVEAQPGGYYLITAPWIAEPERVRGKGKAEARVAQLTADGPPLGFIEGGTVTTIEESGGGWYDVSAPWLDEPIKAQGREAAEAEQLKLHEAGEPADHHGVSLVEGDNGWWTITRPEFDGELKVQGEEAARAAAAQLRAGELIDGQPASWTQTPAEPLEPGAVAVVTGGDLDGQRVTVETIDGENADVATFPDESDNVVTATVPLASLTAAPPEEIPATDEDEGKVDEQKADGGPAATSAPASALPEGGSQQPTESPSADESEGEQP